MIGKIFEFVNDIAALVGWLVIIGGSFWLVAKYFESRDAERKFKADYEKMLKFEDYLRTEYPDTHKRYRECREISALNNEKLHWKDLANKVGVPIDEILKDR